MGWISMNRLFAILIFAVILLGFVVVLQEGMINRIKDEKKQLSDFIKSKDDSIQTYTNDLSEKVLRIRAQELTIRNLKALHESSDLKWLEQFEGLKKNYRNLEDGIRLEFNILKRQVSNNRDTTIINLKGDTTRAYVSNYYDEYNSIKCLATKDTTLHQINIKVPADAVIYWRRKHKLLFIRYGQKEYTGEATSKNPWARITGLNVIRVERR